MPVTGRLTELGFKLGNEGLSNETLVAISQIQWGRDAGDKRLGAGAWEGEHGQECRPSFEGQAGRAQRKITCSAEKGEGFVDADLLTTACTVTGCQEDATGVKVLECAALVGVGLNDFGGDQRFQSLTQAK